MQKYKLFVDQEIKCQASIYQAALRENAKLEQRIKEIKAIL
jgi:hypothetical protein